MHCSFRGDELWVTDGALTDSTSGTGIVLDVNTGPQSSHPTAIQPVDDLSLVFFAADDGSTGR